MYLAKAYSHLFSKYLREIIFQQLHDDTGVAWTLQLDQHGCQHLSVTFIKSMTLDLISQLQNGNLNF